MFEELNRVKNILEKGPYKDLSKEERINKAKEELAKLNIKTLGEEKYIEKVIEITDQLGLIAGLDYFVTLDADTEEPIMIFAEDLAKQGIDPSQFYMMED